MVTLSEKNGCYFIHAKIATMGNVLMGADTSLAAAKRRAVGLATLNARSAERDLRGAGGQWARNLQIEIVEWVEIKRAIQAL